MTADERIEALLNRARQTISDLPKPTEDEYAHPMYTARRAAMMEIVRFQEDDLALYLEKIEATTPDYVVDYILHLTDVIDRMEMALENVCGERDYLRQTAGVDSCWTCVYAGVSEGWRAADDAD